MHLFETGGELGALMGVASSLTVWIISVNALLGAPCTWTKGQPPVTVAGIIADDLRQGKGQEFFTLHVRQQNGSDCTGDVRITLFANRHFSKEHLLKGTLITVKGEVDFYYGQFEVIPNSTLDITFPPEPKYLYWLVGLVPIAILVAYSWTSLKSLFHRKPIASQPKAPNPQLDELRQKVESVETKVAELERRISTTNVVAMMKVEVERLTHQDKALTEDIGRLNKRLPALIPQEGIEPPTFVKDAAIWSEFQSGITNATFRIDIESPWITPNVVRKLVLPLAHALEKGVKVRIRYGYKDKTAADTEKQAVYLRERFSSYGSLFIMKHDNTHGKAFICDDDFLLVGSYNFLSFAGEFTANAPSQIAIKIRDKKAIEKLRAQTFDF